MEEQKTTAEINGNRVTLFQLAERLDYRTNDPYVVVGFTDNGVIVVDVDFDFPRKEVSYGQWEAQFEPQYGQNGIPVFAY